MQFDWIVSPVAQWVFLTLTLLCCLALCASLKLEIAVVRSAFNRSRDSADNLTPLRPEMPAAEMDSTGREQALRRLDRGESPAAISAALRLPRNEVELLLKIRKLANDYAATGKVQSITHKAA